MIFQHLEVSTEASASVPELTGFSAVSAAGTNSTKNADVKLQQLR